MLKIKSCALFATSLFLFTSSFAGVTSSDSAQISRLRITNQCDKTLWIQQDYKSKTNDPIVVEVPAGSSYDYSIPDIGLASTRFWPKSGCNSHGYDCSVGESTGVPDAELQGYQHGPYAPDINSKFEATWGCLKAIFDNNPALCAVNPSSPANHLNADTWWNGSAVDGYTFPYSITVKNHNSSCMDIVTGRALVNPGVNCGQLSVDACPADANLSTEGKYNIINGINVTHVNLQWLDAKTGKPVGCFSPCSKLTTAQGSDNGQTGGGWRNILGGLAPQSPEAQMYCCPTPPITPGVCSAGPAARSNYSLAVHTAQQCDAYTYAYDDAKGLARCGSQSQFEITFCPKSSSNPQPSQVLPVAMKMIVPSNVSAKVNGAAVSNNQAVSLLNGAVLSVDSGSCTVSINSSSVVSGGSGSLCAQLIFDNSGKTITFPGGTSVATGFSFQFNMNTSVGISAYLNNTLIVNATPMDSKNLPKNSVLSAYQGSKQGTCNLVINADSVEKGSGELCVRLNIVKEGTSKVHIYLPADIPNMGGATPTPPPVTKPKVIVFGMASGVYAYFNNVLVTNGSEVTLSTVPNSSSINLIAYQNQVTANCLFGKAGEALNIIPNTGILCNSGLSLVTQNNGNYYIGLPNPIPQAVGTKMYGLGIANGMSITLNDKVILWNSTVKTVALPQGVSNFIIKGVNKTTRTCPITRYNDVLTWPKTAPCVGVVHNAGVIYFPAF